MTFGPMDDTDDELDDEGQEVSIEEAPVYLSLHHHIPLTFGGRPDDGLMLLIAPVISAELASNQTLALTMPVWAGCRRRWMFRHCMRKNSAEFAKKNKGTQHCIPF